jgi:L-iditol 2-dehydrogenase
MKAVVKNKRGFGGVEVIEVPDPVLEKDNQVLIKIESAAICGSDLHAYEYIDSYHWMKIPVVLGHESSGIVVDAGENALFKPGDRVMTESNKSCGVCPNCRVGKSHVCLNSFMRGLAVDGVMSEYIVIEDRFVHHVPESLSFNEAAAAQACTVSAHAVLDRSSIKPGDSVIVTGPGIVGLSCAQLARLKGATNVILTGTDSDEAVRLSLAKELGFDVINVQKKDLSEELYNVTKLNNVDVVIECSGSPHAIRGSMNLIKKGGELLQVGLLPKMEFDFPNAIRKEINVVLSYTSAWHNYEQILKLMDQRKVIIDILLTEYPMSDAVQAMEDALHQKVVKPVLKPFH